MRPGTARLCRRQRACAWAWLISRRKPEPPEHHPMPGWPAYPDTGAGGRGPDVTMAGVLAETMEATRP